MITDPRPAPPFSLNLVNMNFQCTNTRNMFNVRSKNEILQTNGLRSLALVTLDVLRRNQWRISLAEDWKPCQMEEKQEMSLITS